MSIYRTAVQSIGSQAHLFEEEGMLILFGVNVPPELAEYCYLIDVTSGTSPIEGGQFLYFDDEQYEITAVGDVVTKNLSELGHITIKFDGAIEAELPGTMHVSRKEYPKIKLNTKIKITKKR